MRKPIKENIYILLLIPTLYAIICIIAFNFPYRENSLIDEILFVGITILTMLWTLIVIDYIQLKKAWASRSIIHIIDNEKRKAN